MEWVEGEGATEDEAVENAMEKLGASSRDEIKIEVIGKERKFFGFGEEKVKVKAAFNKSPADTGDGKAAEGIEVLQRLLNGMKLEARVEGNREGDTIRLNIFSDYGGILIGRRGETLDSLEHIVDRIVNRKFEDRVNIIVDTENYRERRIEKLHSLAKKLASQVKMTGRPASIASMNARDRKVIHIALRDDLSVETISEGEGFERKVVVSPRRTGVRSL
ncbi:MAG: KH domain-containing protein [Nitrospinae bacterium]|nr:KH domain-containing protein [Nitrospinota bacterium]